MNIVKNYQAVLAMPDKPRLPAMAKGSACGMIFAPHPDDETIIAALPLRLQREAGMRMLVVPVTLGSNAARQPARQTELQTACEVLGFEIITPTANPFTEVTPTTRQEQPILWQGIASKIAAVLLREQPQMIFVPHRYDRHPTHIGTHLLVMDALAQLPPDFSTRVVFTEYWQAQAEPNLLVEIAPPDLEQLIAALSCHVGEITRNPYHRTLPAWLIDNARRGVELVGGFGSNTAPIGFATLYQSGRWQQGSFVADQSSHIIPSDVAVDEWIA